MADKKLSQLLFNRGLFASNTGLFSLHLEAMPVHMRYFTCFLINWIQSTNKIFQCYYTHLWPLASNFVLSQTNFFSVTRYPSLCIEVSFLPPPNCFYIEDTPFYDQGLCPNMAYRKHGRRKGSLVNAADGNTDCIQSLLCSISWDLQLVYGLFLFHPWLEVEK